MNTDLAMEELRNDLINEGIDPDDMIRKVRARIEPLMSKTNEPHAAAIEAAISERLEALKRYYLQVLADNRRSETDSAVLDILERKGYEAAKAAEWVKWDWDDVSTHPKESGYYLCGYGTDTDGMVVDEWDAEKGDFLHYGIYGVWMPVPRYESTGE